MANTDPELKNLEALKFKAAAAQDLRVAISQIEPYSGDVGELAHFLRDVDRLWGSIVVKQQAGWLDPVDIPTLKAALVGRIRRRVLNQIQGDANMDWADLKERLKRSFGGGRWAAEEDLLQLLRVRRGQRQPAGKFAATLLVGYNKILDKLSEKPAGDEIAAATALIMPKLLQVQLQQEVGKSFDASKSFREVAQELVDEGEREDERYAAFSERESLPRDRWEQPGRRSRRVVNRDNQRSMKRDEAQREKPRRAFPREERTTRGQRGNCFECGKSGHIAARCPIVRCFECQQAGHMARHCPYIKRPAKDIDRGEPMEINFHRLHKGRRAVVKGTRQRDSDDFSTSSSSDEEGRGEQQEATGSPTPPLKSYAAVLRCAQARPRKK